MTDQEIKQWLEEHQNESVYDLCRKDAFKCNLPWANTFKMAKDTPEYRAAKATQKAYNDECSRLDELFRAKLRSDYCNGVPVEVFNKAFSLAWERGHSSGYGEVANCFDDIVDSLKEVYWLGFTNGKAAR